MKGLGLLERSNSKPESDRPRLGGSLRRPGAQAPASAQLVDEEQKKRWPWQRLRNREEPAVGGSEWSGSSDGPAKLMTAGLVLGLLTGPVALVLSLRDDAPAIVQEAQSEAAPAGDVVSESTLAGEWGLQTVRSWLASTAKEPKLAENARWPKEATEVSETRVAAVTSAGESGQWQVTVAAAIPGSGDVYFAVPVNVEDDSANAVALPSVVPAPASLPDGPKKLVYEQSSIAKSSPMSSAVADFLTAYVSGEDTTRFTSPGASVSSVEGSPWAQVSVERVDASVPSGEDATTATPAEGEKAQVHVEYVMQRGQDRATGVPASMALSLTARGGRWEITSINPMPELNSQASTESTPSPDGASTTSE